MCLRFRYQICAVTNSEDVVSLLKIGVTVRADLFNNARVVAAYVMFLQASC